MDRRTFLFVLAISFTLFAVNWFFENQNQEKLRAWNVQQQAKKVEKVKALDQEIQQTTAKAFDLPLVTIYADKEGTQYLSEGVKSKDNVLVLSWATHMPSKIYAKISGEETTKEFELAPGPNNTTLQQPTIYQTSSKTTLSVLPLPNFGKFDLQLVVPNANDALHPFDIVYGQYIDGRLTIPKEKLSQLKDEKLASPIISNNAIVLFKTVDGYVPTGIYDPGMKTLTSFDNFPTLSIKKPETKNIALPGQKSEEKFFVIENEYQQLVFSNYGGALIEVNLPFQTVQNKKSVVREIEFDRDMKEHHPYNAMFPAHPFYTAGSKTEGPFIENAKGQLGGYYPLLRRDLIESQNRQSIRVKPEHYGLNIVSEYPELAELVYEVKYFDQKTIVFEAVQSQRRIKKTFTVNPEDKDAPYCLNLTLELEGDARGLWLTSGVPDVEIISGSPAPALKYRVTRNQKVDVENIDLPKDAITFSTVKPDWACNSNGFLGIILDPLTDVDSGLRAFTIPGSVMPSRLTEIDQEYDKYKAQDLPGYELLLPLDSKGGTMKFRYFAGPFSSDILKTIDKVYSDTATGYNPDYIACQTFHGWFSFISEPFAKFLFILMDFFHYLTNSWGLSIILLTLALRIMMYPLNAWSTKSMLRMQQIAPEVTTIQEKYKKDPKKAQVEVMNLYRERGVNPVSGCFPLLIQMPFLIGMFDLLKSTFELRGASFIPGWIDNLTSPDVLFSWKTPIYFIGNQFHLLPILLGAVMFVQQRMMSNLPEDPKLWTDQQKQQRLMGNMMTVVFAIMFYNFPSGLNIYWLSSMILGIAQQWWTQKRLKAIVPMKKEVETKGGKSPKSPSIKKA